MLRKDPGSPIAAVSGRYNFNVVDGGTTLSLQLIVNDEADQQLALDQLGLEKGDGEIISQRDEAL